MSERDFAYELRWNAGDLGLDDELARELGLDDHEDRHSKRLRLGQFLSEAADEVDRLKAEVERLKAGDRPTPATDQILDGIAHDLEIWEQQGPLDKPLLMHAEVARPAAFLAEHRRRKGRESGR